MSNRSIIEYLNLLRAGYRGSFYKDKQKTITEVCRNLGWNRKSAIRALNQPIKKEKSQKRTRKKKFSWQAQKHIRKLWKLMDQMCSKKMVVALPRWLRSYKACSDEVKAELVLMSAATIDRYLSKYRTSVKRRSRSGTKPGACYFKNRIPIKPLDRNITECGVVEADTVAHCGDSMSGVFAWSLTITDIKTGWTENAAIWGKSGKGVVKAVKACQANMPFAIKEFYCDNGTEFLNNQLLLYFSNVSSQKKKDIIKRGRPYRKNDQCHVEQKNFTHVRQLFGYSRIDKKEIIELMNDVYLNEWSKLQNFFVPQMKLIRKTKIGSKYKREYSQPMTPYDRVLADPTVALQKKHELQKEFEKLDPFEIQDRIQKKTKKLFKLLEILSKEEKAA